MKLLKRNECEPAGSENLSESCSPTPGKGHLHNWACWIGMWLVIGVWIGPGIIILWSAGFAVFR